MDPDDDIFVLNSEDLQARGGDGFLTTGTPPKSTESHKALINAYQNLKSRYNELHSKHQSSLKCSSMYDQNAEKPYRAPSYSLESEAVGDSMYGAGPAGAGSSGPENRAKEGIRTYLERELRTKSAECQNLQRSNGALTEKNMHLTNERDKQSSQFNSLGQQLDQERQVFQHKLEEERLKMQEIIEDQNKKILLMQDDQKKAEETMKFEQSKYDNLKEDRDTLVAKLEKEIERLRDEVEMCKKRQVIPRCSKCSNTQTSNVLESRARNLESRSSSATMTSSGSISKADYDEIVKLKGLTAELKKTVEEQQRTIQQYHPGLSKKPGGAASLPAVLPSSNKSNNMVMTTSTVLPSSSCAAPIGGPLYVNHLQHPQHTTGGPLYANHLQHPQHTIANRSKSADTLSVSDITPAPVRKASDSQILPSGISIPPARSTQGPLSEPSSRHTLNLSHQHMYAESTVVKPPLLVASDSQSPAVPSRNSQPRTGVTPTVNLSGVTPPVNLSVQQTPNLALLQPSDAPSNSDELLNNEQPRARNMRNPQENEDASNSAVHICPVCDTDLSYLALDDFQTHVLECFGTETPTMQPVTEPFGSRNCPMCNQLFSADVTQDVFEGHVNSHFADDPTLDFQVLSP